MAGAMRRMRDLRYFAVVALACCFLVCGCKKLLTASKDAEGLDAGFHTAMKNGNWVQMYADADPIMREKTSQQDFVALFSAIQRKLGDPVSFKQTGWRVNTTTSGTYLDSQCETVFSKDATGTESFVWRKDGGQYRLAGYDVNSNALITR